MQKILITSAAENKEIINFINKKKADVLWVWLVQTKREKWIYENFEKLDTKFVDAVGAVFNFYSEQIKRVPNIIQNLGLEWFYRICQEPTRLWKRNLFCNLNFIFVVMPYLFLVRLKFFFNLQ